MLAFIKEHKVKHVIVHKIDRMARNRADDVEINLELSAAGAQLVSCSENIDETPSGMLLHGIMSSIAEFYSHNLAAESKKGMRQKAINGGTPGMASFGYINAHLLTDDGRQVRTVVIDEDRAPWVRWAYEKYVNGDWTTSMIRDECNRLGVTTRRRPNRPERPISTSHVNAILRNRYYVGVVRYEGIEYPGSHEPLISEALFTRSNESGRRVTPAGRSRASGASTSRDRSTAGNAASRSALPNHATAPAGSTTSSTASGART